MTNSSNYYIVSDSFINKFSSLRESFIFSREVNNNKLDLIYLSLRSLYESIINNMYSLYFYFLVWYIWLLFFICFLAILSIIMYNYTYLIRYTGKNNIKYDRNNPPKYIKIDKLPPITLYEMFNRVSKLIKGFEEEIAKKSENIINMDKGTEYFYPNEAKESFKEIIIFINTLLDNLNKQLEDLNKQIKFLKKKESVYKWKNNIKNFLISLLFLIVIFNPLILCTLLVIYLKLNIII